MAALPDDDLVIVRDESIERGIAKVRADGALRMHPLTALHFEHEGNPFAQLDAIRNYVVERAHRELDAVQWQIFIRTCPEKFERLRRRFERAQIYYSLPGSGDPRLPVPNFGG
ncbi:MAG: hypothetical protein D3X82_16780 [Candidatus Leucobacter sulfamidivorax]|nr:hypothetical protein [Candidatus Leucobacter sulfamidivorax]